MTGTVLVTGASGFVGRQVLRALAQHETSVVAVVREGKQALVQGHDGVDAVLATADLFAEGADWWANACRGVDTVVHLAWYAEPGHYLQSARNLACLAGTLQLANGAARAGVRRFVGIGTCFEYEMGAQPLSTETALKPGSPYAGAKAAAFMALSTWLPAQGVQFAWCRLFYLHGEGEDARRLVPYLRTRLAAGEPAELGPGGHIRDYLDVREAGRQIAQVALGDLQGACNICSAVPVTVRELAERIAAETGRPDLLRFGARPANDDDPACVVGIR